MKQNFVKNAALIRALQTIENIAKFTIFRSRAPKTKLWVALYSFFKFVQNLEKIQHELLSASNRILYFQIHCVLKNWHENNEDYEYQRYGPSQRPMCAMNSGEAWRESYEKHAAHQVSYTCSTEEHDHLLVPKLSQPW